MNTRLTTDRKDEASCGRAANGGNCLVSWEKDQRPVQFRGLGIHNLETLGWSLRIRWLWAQKTDEEHLWAGLPVQVPRIAEHCSQPDQDHSQESLETTYSGTSFTEQKLGG